MVVKNTLSLRIPIRLLDELERVGPNHLRGGRANTARVMWALEQFVNSRKSRVSRETAIAQSAGNNGQ